jgi:endonuclease YncB( thermonuclease family)
MMFAQPGQHALLPLTLPFGKEVTVQTYSLDKYRRTIAYVLLPDGTNVNHALVKDGWWWNYVPGETMLEVLENDA